MEEVWKDITFSSLHDHQNSNANAFHSLSFQDFLAQPSHKNTPTTVFAGVYSSPAYAPATALTLNSAGPDHEFNPLHAQPFSNVSSLSTIPFDALASDSSLPALGKKRLTESESSSGDRRHKRMIKNRESAARSRARKQAYTNELELEVAHLMEENARLKRQQEICLASATQVSKKHGLYRTSTAPF